LENQYYNSKALKEDSLEEALAGFAKVISLQTDKGDWGFKALKQMLKINFRLGELFSSVKLTQFALVR